MEKKSKVIIFILLFAIFVSGIYIKIVKANTNISSTNYWAWSDTSGWWDFYSTGTVDIQAPELHGYATSSVGYIVLNCDSSPIGDICGNSNFAVTNLLADGVLSGCAWNDTIGWISFNCANYDCQGGNTCNSSEYKVTINANGNFEGYAWNDIEGWISFNCANNNSCNSSNYFVNTDWRRGVLSSYLESRTIDKGENTALQSIIWQGSQPTDTKVEFRIAAATSTSGPWIYEGPGEEEWFSASCTSAPEGGVGSPEPVGPNIPICINKSISEGMQYIRYKVRLQSNGLQNTTPIIENIILNWSK
jgi:hypothetical protein